MVHLLEEHDGAVAACASLDIAAKARFQNTPKELQFWARLQLGGKAQHSIHGQILALAELVRTKNPDHHSFGVVSQRRARSSPMIFELRTQ